jgi:hypothetical protein
MFRPQFYAVVLTVECEAIVNFLGIVQKTALSASAWVVFVEVWKRIG